MSIDLKGQIDDVLKGSVELLTGGSANIQSKTIYENGTYNPPSGVNGFAPVIVDVPQLQLEDRYINANGQYGPSEGYDGMRSVTVDVPVPSILPVTLTENGVYESTGGSGFSPVTVNVPQNCEKYSSNEDKLRLYENIFNGISILSFNGLYINQTMAFTDIDSEYIRNKLTTLNVNPYARVFNSSSQTTSYNQLGIDATSQIIRYYNNDLGSYDVGNVYGSIVLISSDLIAGQYPIQVCPNIS